jgi:hypothetical protein
VGKKAIGGGFELNNTTRLVIISSRPTAAGDGWSATAYMSQDSGSSNTVTAFAICA